MIFTKWVVLGMFSSLGVTSSLEVTLPPPGPGPALDPLVSHAEQLRIDEATLTRILELREEHASVLDPLRAEHDAARDKLARLLAEEELDRQAVLEQAGVVEDFRKQINLIHLSSVLDARMLLTREQRRLLEEIRREMRPPHRPPRHRPRGRRHRRPGEDRPGDGRRERGGMPLEDDWAPQ